MNYRQLKLWIFVFFLTLIVSCAKENNGTGLTSNAAALTVVNIINGSNGFYMNFTPLQGGKGFTDTLQWYSSAAKITYGSSTEFSSYNGEQRLGIASVTDTIVEEWTGNLALPVGSIHSLYFAGPDTLHIDTLFTTDEPPNYPMGDSSVGVRFIHLVPMADPVTVDIQNGSDTLASGLSYKGVTEFFTLPVTKASPVNGMYVFEFRDAMTGNLLTTYSYSKFNYFKSITVVLAGNSANNLWKTYIVKDY